MFAFSQLWDDLPLLSMNYNYHYHDNQGCPTMKAEVQSFQALTDRWKGHRAERDQRLFFSFSLIIRHCLSWLRSATLCRLNWEIHIVILTAEVSDISMCDVYVQRVIVLFHFCVWSVRDRILWSVSTAEMSQCCYLSSFRSERRLLFPPSQTGAEWCSPLQGCSHHAELYKGS